jgi:hypothetical protein
MLYDYDGVCGLCGGIVAESSLAECGGVDACWHCRRWDSEIELDPPEDAYLIETNH